jgi:hypothetical protein
MSATRLHIVHGLPYDPATLERWEVRVNTISGPRTVGSYRVSTCCGKTVDWRRNLDMLTNDPARVGCLTCRRVMARWRHGEER